MNHAFAVRVGERERDLLHQARDARRVERRLLLCELEEVPPWEILDDEVQEPVDVSSPIENRDDAVVPDSAGCSGFEAEARDGFAVVRISWIQDLDRHLALERNLLCSIDPTDGPPAYHRSENVFAVENPPRKLVLVHFDW